MHFFAKLLLVKLQRCFPVSVEDFAKTMAGRSYSRIRETLHASRQLLEQVCQSQIHTGAKKIGYNLRTGLVQCLLKHIEMIARSLLN